jgi:hypothetical protein
MKNSKIYRKKVKKRQINENNNSIEIDLKKFPVETKGCLYK